eukprot:CAMPEP_0183318026 /NCGR_PEP_ID=MMETSP0160_2-20130417/59504_1 /TAXON_ID=2839 ORGANISM="Odontella Sinensis, Strain Grunow 1884" /NCGR_SAMPLE_ID=MMETSP0160_2 /ASSEMBLY_ACC=CAM_ASM_000250 /LENGTH=74 /DNA_ID=CAMNT_0025484183 /DNA_START=89 /DNA_END=310 /DNA_ORIENTATION=+
MGELSLKRQHLLQTPSIVHVTVQGVVRHRKVQPPLYEYLVCTQGVPSAPVQAQNFLVAEKELPATAPRFRRQCG